MITIVMAHYNAVKFLEYTLPALQCLTKNKYYMVICDNGSDGKQLKQLLNMRRDGLFDEIIMRKQSAKGNIGHGEALNVLVKRVKTKYGVFLESDVMPLCKNWDQMMIDRINGKIKIVGSHMPPNPLRPTDFPNVFFSMFDAKVFKLLGIDMMPKDIYKGQDIGWEMREKFTDAGYRGLPIRTVNTRTDGRTPFGKVLCTVSYIDNDIVCSHFGRGSTGGEGKFRGPKFLRMWYGYKEIVKWLDKCEEVIGCNV